MPTLPIKLAPAGIDAVRSACNWFPTESTSMICARLVVSRNVPCVPVESVAASLNTPPDGVNGETPVVHAAESTTERPPPPAPVIASGLVALHGAHCTGGPLETQQ